MNEFRVISIDFIAVINYTCLRLFLRCNVKTLVTALFAPRARYFEFYKIYHFIPWPCTTFYIVYDQKLYEVFTQHCSSYSSQEILKIPLRSSFITVIFTKIEPIHAGPNTRKYSLLTLISNTKSARTGLTGDPIDNQIFAHKLCYQN